VLCGTQVQNSTSRHVITDPGLKTIIVQHWSAYQCHYKRQWPLLPGIVFVSCNSQDLALPRRRTIKTLGLGKSRLSVFTKPTGHVMHQPVQHSTTVRSAHTVFIWKQTATFATYSINWLVFITEMKSVYSAVRTGALHIILCSAHIVFVCFVFI